MKLVLINILFCITAALLVFLSPNHYSYQFCLAIAILFIVQNLSYFILKKDKDIVCFESFFAVAFGVTNFVYPLVYYAANPNFSVFDLPFNYEIISYATAVAYLAYTVFLLFISFATLKYEPLAETNEDTESVPVNIDYSRLLKQMLVLAVISFLGYILTGGYDSLVSEYLEGGANLLDKGISSYFYVVFYTCAVLISFFLFEDQIQFKAKIFYFILTSLIIIFFLAAGSRTLPLSLALCLIIAYNNNIKRISFSRFLLLIGLGAVTLTFVMLTRITGTGNISAIQDTDITSVWDFATDLIINNRNLYTLIDHAQTSGYTYGTTMLGGLLAPLPFAAGAIVNMTDIPADYLTSAGFNTVLDLGFGSDWGLGTNLVSDAYLAFGMVGVVFFFGLLGFIIGKAKFLRISSIYWKICYYIIASYAVFLVRGGFFDCFRYIIWGILLVFIFNLLKKKTQFYDI